MTSITKFPATNLGPALVVGGAGYIGRFVSEACLSSGCPTYILVRPGLLSCPSRDATIKALREKGAIILDGSVHDKELIQKLLKDYFIDVVISVIGGGNILDQLSLIDAIKNVGTVKRFLPSEFGHDIDKAHPVEPGLSLYKQKRMVRRVVETAGIPYTYICCNSIAGWPYHNQIHPSKVCPPLDHFLIYGDGDVRAFFVAGSDIGKFTIKVAYDPRTVNRAIHFRPTCNFVSLNEMASMWEAKIGRTLPRRTLNEEKLLDMAAENCIPSSVVAAITHDIFIKGCQFNYTIDGYKDVELSCLYPDIKYRTIEECFKDYMTSMNQGLEFNKPTSIVDRMPVPAATCAIELV